MGAVAIVCGGKCAKSAGEGISTIYATGVVHIVVCVCVTIITVTSKNIAADAARFGVGAVAVGCVFPIVAVITDEIDDAIIGCIMRSKFVFVYSFIGPRFTIGWSGIIL